MANIISLRKYLALKELEIVFPLESKELELFVDTLEEGNSLAKALREIGLKSAYEIPQETWDHLRPWYQKFYMEKH